MHHTRRWGPIFHCVPGTKFLHEFSEKVSSVATVRCTCPVNTWHVPTFLRKCHSRGPSSWPPLLYVYIYIYISSTFCSSSFWILHLPYLSRQDNVCPSKDELTVSWPRRQITTYFTPPLPRDKHRLWPNNPAWIAFTNTAASLLLSLRSSFSEVVDETLHTTKILMGNKNC